MTHLFGLLYFMTPLRPVEVQARMRMQDASTDLEDAILVSFDNGAIATFTGTARAGSEWRQHLIIHAENCCVTDDPADTFSSITWDRKEKQGFGNIPDYQTCWLVAGNLVDVIRGRAGNGSPASCGVRAVETIEAAYLSAARDGAPVRIEELYT